MEQAKDWVGIVPKLHECIHIANTIDQHNKQLLQQVAHLEPSYNTVKAMLMKVGFDSETTNEDNLRLLLDHHTALVAENTKLHKTTTNRDALMKQLREVVLESAD